MKYRTFVVREGEAVGPIDWDHQMAKDKPNIWRDAESNPGKYLFHGYELLAISMYDGGPYWNPVPSVLFYGPIGPEWEHFNGYGVNANSIQPRRNPKDGG